MPRQQLDTARVVRAAADLVNAEGWEALSLARLAAQIGIQTPSLYNHVKGLPDLRRELAVLSNRELAEAMANAAIGQAGAAAIRQIAQAFRAYIRANPGLYQATVYSAALHQPIDPALDAAQGRATQVGLVVMQSLGLQGTEAIHALRGLRSLVHGFTLLELSGGFGLPVDSEESFQRILDIFLAGLQKSM